MGEKMRKSVWLGKTDSTIVFTDTLGEGSTFVTDPASWQLQYWGQANGEFPDKGVTLADGNGVVDGSQGKFTVTPTIERWNAGYIPAVFWAYPFLFL